MNCPMVSNTGKPSGVEMYAIYVLHIVEIVAWITEKQNVYMAAL